MIAADVSVRPALPDDADHIARVQLVAWREALGEAGVAAIDPAQVAAAWQRAITEAPDPRSRVLAALSGARVVGFAATTPARRADEDAPPPAGEGWTAEVIALEVDPAHRRQGHGSRLLAASADLARERGGHHIAAWALRDDSARIAFLSAAGLAEVGVLRRLDTPGGEAEEILLTAALDAAS